MKKAITLLLICIVIIGSLAGCGSKDPIVGTWIDSKHSEEALYFNSDGTIGYRDETEDSKSGDGSMHWVKEGNTYYYVATTLEGEEVERYKITLNGDELSYSYGSIYMPCEYYREK